jgi:hemerythrin-like domain-containing protein
MTTTQQAWPDQQSYPGQTHVAPGPHDMTNMYRAHFAFRRDLAAFESAVRQTPVGAADSWRALADRWAVFADVLHHHHTIEDVMIWPVLLARTEATDDAAGTELLHAMEAEHDLIDPALTGCTLGFATMVVHPCEDHRNALDVHVTTARELLADHLRHEETEAIPLIQSTMTAEEWEASEAYAAKGLDPRKLASVVPWMVEGMSPELLAREAAAAPLLMRLLLRLFGRRWTRRERVAFRYASAAQPAS